MIKLFNRFLRWRSYRKNLAVRYKLATGKSLPWAFGMSSKTAELIIEEYYLFGGRMENEREPDEWDDIMDDIND